MEAMMRKALALIVLSASALGTFALLGRAQERGDLTKFMRQKLDHSQRVLEGLAREDFALIGRNARALRELSEDAQWRVSPNINYLRYSNEFQGLAEELAERAKERNLDGATLSYLKLTMNCIECHKYVRKNNLIGLAGPGGAVGEGR
jgi:hypothetical protein